MIQCRTLKVNIILCTRFFYYTDGQKPEEYQSYTMKIGCNAAGCAEFETTYLGTTNVASGDSVRTHFGGARIILVRHSALKLEK